MQATLEEIHGDPAILDRAIKNGIELDIVDDGQVQATVMPTKKSRLVRKAASPLPDFAKRRAEMGMERLPPELEATFFRAIRGE